MAQLRDVVLDDKYRLSEGRVFMTGVQALVRLPLEQRRRDLAAGRNTAGYITGYRGSPLGGYDQQLERARGLLAEHQIVHQPGVNEDLAATACQGTQQAGLHGEGRFEGVFAIWYGKGPGVDRTGDAIRHGNLFGTAPLGGVLLLLGDDHICESSTTAHQSEYAMVDAMVPVLNPAGVQEILEYGLLGIAMSRFSRALGRRSSASTTRSRARPRSRSGRSDPAIAARRLRACRRAGSTSAYPEQPGRRCALEVERLLHVHKLEAAKAFARANRIDRIVLGGTDATADVVTAGKCWQDVVAALDELGIDERAGARAGRARLQGRHDLAARAAWRCRRRSPGPSWSWSSRRSAA